LATYPILTQNRQTQANKQSLLFTSRTSSTLVNESSCFKPGLRSCPPITGTVEAYLFISSLWDKELITLQEQMLAVFMNRTGQVIGYRLLNTGNISHCEIDTRLLVSLALHCMASSVIIAHNQPSGNLTPSEADKTLTKKVSDALTLIDVTLLDHLIISKVNWLSMSSKGLL
jgi:DNA repair protein RadC